MLETSSPLHAAGRGHEGPARLRHGEDHRLSNCLLAGALVARNAGGLR